MYRRMNPKELEKVIEEVRIWKEASKRIKKASEVHEAQKEEIYRENEGILDITSLTHSR